MYLLYLSAAHTDPNMWSIPGQEHPTGVLWVHTANVQRIKEDTVGYHISSSYNHEYQPGASTVSSGYQRLFVCMWFSNLSFQCDLNNRQSTVKNFEQIDGKWFFNTQSLCAQETSSRLMR